MCVCVDIMGSAKMGEAAFGKTLTLPLGTWTKINEVQQKHGFSDYAAAITWCVAKAVDSHVADLKPKKHGKRAKHGRK